MWSSSTLEAQQCHRLQRLAKALQRLVTHQAPYGAHVKRAFPLQQETYNSSYNLVENGCTDDQASDMQ